MTRSPHLAKTATVLPRANQIRSKQRGSGTTLTTQSDKFFPVHESLNLWARGQRRRMLNGDLVLSLSDHKSVSDRRFRP